MRDRKTIQQDIQDQKEIIKQTKENITKLRIEEVQVTDDKYRYEEKEETWYKEISNGRGKRRSKVPETHMVGRRYWTERFYDEDNKELYVDIERSEIVRIDGEWAI